MNNADYIRAIASGARGGTGVMVDAERLEEIAASITDLLEALKCVYKRLPDNLARDLGWVEAFIAKAEGK